MTLREKQTEFARLLARLIDQAFVLGYEITMGDVYRDPRAFGPIGQKRGYGNPSSTHKSRLAADLLLFRNGVYLTQTDDYRPLGEWWEKQHPFARWGGRFADGNHFSFEHNGVS